MSDISSSAFSAVGMQLPPDIVRESDNKAFHTAPECLFFQLSSTSGREIGLSSPRVPGNSTKARGTEFTKVGEMSTFSLIKQCE